MEAIKYLILDIELIYRNRKYCVGYASDFFLSWSTIINRSNTTKFVSFANWFVFKGFKEYIFSFIFIFIYFWCVLREIYISIKEGLYSFLKARRIFLVG